MSTFIPMVSTTPPPIDDDDDDFGDFMDGGGDENDDFADFSSPKDFDDFSYPSVNPLSDNVNSLDQETDDEEPSINIPPLTREAEDDGSDQEVTKVMADKHQGNPIKPSRPVFEQENTIQMSCNGSTMEDDWLPSGNEDAPVPISEDSGSSQHSSNEQKSFSDDSVSCDDEDKPNEKMTTENIRPTEPRADVAEQGFGLENIQTDDAIEYTGDNFVALEPTVNPVEKAPKADQLLNSIKDNQHDLERTDAILPSQQYMSDDVWKGDVHLQNSPTKDKCGESNLKITQPSLDSVDDENCDDSLSQPPFVSDGHDYQREIENQTPSESVKIEAGEGHEDFNVDQQDAQACSQTSINNSHIIDNPLPKSPRRRDIPLDSDQDLQFNTNFDDADDGDDFADFGSFNTGPFEAPQDEESRESIEFNAFESNDALPDHDDGFADYSNAGNDKVAHDNDDFGGFSTNNDDDFGDFDSNSTNWAGFSDTVTKKLSLHEKVDSFVSRYAAEMDEDADAQIPHLDEHLISDTLCKDVESPSMASVESGGIVWPGDLWDQLEDIDNTIALSFVWNGSYHNKYLLDALGMRTQNILFSGTKQAYYVPTYYAAALGMVDPNKGIMKPMSAAEKITAISPTEKNFPVVGEVSVEESHPEWKTIADEQTSGQGMTVASSWLHSKPSVCNQDDSEIASKSLPIFSSALDLDYFDNLPTATENLKHPGGTDLIDPELLEVTSAPSTEPPPPPKDPANATLSKILASIKGDSNATSLVTTQYSQNRGNSKWADEENMLSGEARSVLQKLPDLSYMRSKVLIFPMNMSRMTIGEE